MKKHLKLESFRKHVNEIAFQFSVIMSKVYIASIPC